jgi:hypothetical protein
LGGALGGFPGAVARRSSRVERDGGARARGARDASGGTAHGDDPPRRRRLGVRGGVRAARDLRGKPAGAPPPRTLQGARLRRGAAGREDAP